jgi:hypothetical protein
MTNPFFLAGLFTTMLGLVSKNGTLPIAEDDSSRIYSVLEDQCAAAEQAPLFAGDAAVEATALALSAVAFHESFMLSGVQDCSLCQVGSKWCDSGRSITLYQLHVGSWGQHTRQELCEDNVLATARALDILSLFRKAWRTDLMFCGYAMGGVRPGCNQASKEIDSVFKGLAQQAGIVVTPGNPIRARWK